MTLRDAYKQVVPFGKFKGKTLLDIAKADITYLPWLRDKAEKLDLVEACTVICDANVQEIDDAIQRREHRKRGW